MEYNVVSIRPFIGSKDFDQSRSFYLEIGFTEISITPKMSLFQNKKFGFYLQDAYVQEWVENTMIFLEVENLDKVYRDLLALNLNARYPEVNLVPIREEDWGRECFLLDPAGNLLHFGTFK